MIGLVHWFYGPRPRRVVKDNPLLLMTTSGDLAGPGWSAQCGAPRVARPAVFADLDDADGWPTDTAFMARLESGAAGRIGMPDRALP
jgi:hypothetical protein